MTTDTILYEHEHFTDDGLQCRHCLGLWSISLFRKPCTRLGTPPAQIPTRSCTCGARAVGCVDGGPGHSGWCDVAVKP